MELVVRLRASTPGPQLFRAMSFRPDLPGDPVCAVCGLVSAVFPHTHPIHAPPTPHTFNIQYCRLYTRPIMHPWLVWLPGLALTQLLSRRLALLLLELGMHARRRQGPVPLARQNQTYIVSLG